jgi:hypothetical protein
MSKWDIPRHDERISEISRELTRHLTKQTEFLRNDARVGATEEEFHEYEASRERVRELFAELERLRRAA